MEPTQWHTAEQVLSAGTGLHLVCKAYRQGCEALQCKALRDMSNMLPAWQPN